MDPFVAAHNPAGRFLPSGRSTVRFRTSEGLLVRTNVTSLSALLKIEHSQVTGLLTSPGGRKILRQHLDEAPPPAEPDWRALVLAVRDPHRPPIEGFSPQELELMIRIFSGEGCWKALNLAGQWDVNHRVRHIRPSDLPEWGLQLSLQIHERCLYVLGVGSDRARIGHGFSKRPAYALELMTLTNAVYASVGGRIPEFSSITFLHQIARTEISLIKRLDGSSRVINLRHSLNYSAKEQKGGVRKIGMMLEYCNSGELYDAIDRSCQTRAALRLQYEIPTLLQVVRDMMEILAVLDVQGIVHRDIKPENLLLHENRDGRLRLKLIDMGLSNTVYDEVRRLRSGGELVGTRGFVSPEFVWDRDPYVRSTTRSDVWSMGVTLFALLQGALPKCADMVLTRRFFQEDVTAEIDELKWCTGPVKFADRPICLQSEPGRKVFFRLVELLEYMLIINVDRRYSGTELLRVFDRLFPRRDGLWT